MGADGPNRLGSSDKKRTAALRRVVVATRAGIREIGKPTWFLAGLLSGLFLGFILGLITVLTPVPSAEPRRWIENMPRVPAHGVTPQSLWGWWSRTPTPRRAR